MENQILVKMVLDAWDAKVKEANAVFDKLTDEQLQLEVAPGRNRGIYLLGHLTAAHDRCIPLLNFGNRLYPKLDAVFIDHADKSTELAFTANELRSYWKNVNAVFADNFNKLSPEAWFERHTAISEEDYIKQPHRNKLNVILARTNHLAYHTGQLMFLKK